MKSSILLLVLYSLQVSALKEERTPNTSPVQNIQAISPQDGDNLHLGISAQATPVCKNIADNFVNCLFSSPQFRRHMQQTLCKETEDKLIAKLRTEIVDLNKKLSLMQQREDDNTRKLETIELETSLRMQEKEKEVNKTLASCRRETFETNKRLQALENLINTTEHRIIETVKHHSGLNFKHIDNAISSNKDNIASFTNTLNEKLEMVEQRENDSTTKLENLLKEIEARLSLKFMQEKEINNTMASRFIEISETANRIENLINISEHRIKETVKVHFNMNSILVENATSLNMQQENGSTTNLENALNEMSLKFVEKQKELNDTLRLFSETRNHLQSLLVENATSLNMQQENGSTTNLENALNEISLKFVEKQKELNDTLRLFSETRSHLQSLLVENVTSLNMRQKNDSKTKLKNALNEISLKFVDKQNELNETLRLFSETRNRLQSLENLIITKKNNISNLTLELAEMEIKLSKWAPVPPDSVRLPTGIYLFVNIQKSWSNARKHCQDRGMDLVAIETEAEDKALMQHAKSMGGGISKFAYTSGCYSTASGSFVWRSTGHPLTYTNWANGYPTATSDSQCIQIRTNYNNWGHYPDSEPFICEFI